MLYNSTLTTCLWLYILTSFITDGIQVCRDICDLNCMHAESVSAWPPVLRDDDLFMKESRELLGGRGRLMRRHGTPGWNICLQYYLMSGSHCHRLKLFDRYVTCSSALETYCVVLCHVESVYSSSKSLMWK